MHHGKISLTVRPQDNISIIEPVNETDNVIFLPFNDEEALEKCFAENASWKNFSCSGSYR